MKLIKFLEEKIEDKNILKEKIIKWIIENPNPPDSKFHKFSKDMNMDPDELETISYSILTDFWAHGRYQEKGQNKNFDNKELNMGIEIEMEHTSNKIMAERIAMDHLTEIPDYYTRLKKMEKEAGIKI